MVKNGYNNINAKWFNAQIGKIPDNAARENLKIKPTKAI